MKTMKIRLSILILVISVMLVISCGKKITTNPQNNAIKNSSIVLKVSSVKVNQKTNIPVIGGEIELQSAMVNIDNFSIQENSGNDVENVSNDNEDNNGSDKENNNENEGGNENNGGSDIIISGPFSLDIAAGEVLIDTVSVYPGTYKKVDATININQTDTYNGKSIIIDGNFINSDNSIVPFTLKSDFVNMLKFLLANGGITVNENTVAEIIVNFDISTWFANTEFGKATITNNEILIDNQNNTEILTVFENNLLQHVDNDTEESGDGED